MFQDLLEYQENQKSILAQDKKQKSKETVAELIALILQNLAVNSDNKNWQVKQVVTKRVLPALIEACKLFSCPHLTKHMLDLMTIICFIEWEKKQDQDTNLSHLGNCLRAYAGVKNKEEERSALILQKEISLGAFETLMTFTIPNFFANQRPNELKV